MKQRGSYRHHPLSFKLALVEQSLQPDVSVAKLAREHGVNANQVFAWRRAYREGRLEQPAFLPVTLAHKADVPEVSAMRELHSALPSGRIMIEQGGLRLTIEGRPDSQTLSLVLSALPR